MSDVKIGALKINATDDGVVLTVHLVVSGSDVAGVGHYTDSIKKRSFAVTFEGKTHSTGLGTAKQLFGLHGKALPNIPGASSIPTLSFSLDGIWGATGHAEYGVWTDTPAIELHKGLIEATWS